MPKLDISRILSRLSVSESPEFGLEKRFSIVTSPNDAVAQAFADKLRIFLQRSGVADFDLSNFASSRNIMAASVDSIKGGGNYSVDVSKNLITVNFTSPSGMNGAYSALTAGYTDRVGLIKRLANKRYRRFTKVEHSGRQSVSASERIDIIDLLAHDVDCQAVKGRLHDASSAGATTVYMIFMNEKGWRIESPVMSLINPDDLPPAGDGYSYPQIREIKSTADNLGLKIVPVIDIATAYNPAFEQFTGHAIHSTEGLRFSRALAKEFCSNSGFPTLCLGKEPEDKAAVRRFIEPVAAEIEAIGGMAVML